MKPEMKKLIIANLPLHAPPSFSDRSTLWNSVELYEKAGNAQLAREIDAALPIELSREEQIRLLLMFQLKVLAGNLSKVSCFSYAIFQKGATNERSIFYSAS